MTAPLAASIAQFLLGLQLGARAGAPGNRWAIEGVAWSPQGEGQAGLRIAKLEAESLHLASGPFSLEIDKIALHELVGQFAIGSGEAPHLSRLEAARAEVSGLKLAGPVAAPGQLLEVWRAWQARRDAAAPTAAPPPPDAWRLGPLATADGTLRAHINDAHLMFDADVRVPIRHGLVDFDDATVEHVGPDSRMGVSKLGLYVDAPNGRSYLYQFASAPLDGVEFERRSALIGPWISDRGKILLQPFAESMLRQFGSRPVGAGENQGLTEQARLLLGRTAISGQVQLGDGRFAVPGLQATTTGESEGRNAIVLQSQAVGEGLGAEVAALSASDLGLAMVGAQLQGANLDGSLKLQLSLGRDQMHFALELPQVRMQGLRVEWP